LSVDNRDCSPGGLEHLQKDSLLPIPGGWEKMEHTHIRLAASEDVLMVHFERRGKCAWMRTQRQAEKNHVAEPDLATLEVAIRSSSTTMPPLAAFTTVARHPPG